MRKARRYTIYSYKRKKTRKKKSKVNFRVAFNLFLLFLAILFLLIISRSYLYNSNNISDSIGLAAGSKFLSLNGDIKHITPSPTQFPVFAGLLPKIGISGTSKSKPKKTLSVPVAEAQTNTESDYCLNVPVLLYHHIQPYAIAEKLGHAQLTVDSEFFDMQMAYLVANKYHTLSADELADALINRHQLPDKSILITIDDGYDDNYAYAFQIMKKYNVTGNFMIPTGLMEKNGYLTWKQIKEMAENPLMHIYNHTLSHAALDGLSKEQAEFEIKEANKQLEDNLGIKVNIFTYPYGYFNDQAIQILKDNGFIAAFSTQDGITQCSSFIYTLHRIRIGSAPMTSYGL